MTPEFSSRPGRYERHLQRKSNNVLFPREERRISPDQVDRARKRDSEELQNFLESYHAVLGEVAELAQNADSELVLKLKQRLDQLYEQVCGLGGDRSAEKSGLSRLLQAIDRAIAAGAAGDPVAEAQLAQEAQARRIHWQMLQQPLVADLLRPDSPVSRDDLLPSLLSLEKESFAVAMDMFDPEQHRSLLARATELLKNHSNEPGLENARACVEFLQKRVTAMEPGR